jgi:hypothetical protein
LYCQSKTKTPKVFSRLAVCAFFLFCSLAGAAWAEGAQATAVVVFSDGQKAEFKSGDPRDPLDALKTLLYDQRDGTCQVQEDGKVVLTMVKAGDRVKLTSQGKEKTWTLQAAREEIDMANAMSQAGLRERQNDKADGQSESTERLKEPVPMTIPEPKVLLFDGRVDSGMAKMPPASAADTSLILEEVKARAKEPVLAALGGVDRPPSAENFAVYGAASGAFTRRGSEQKAFLYRYSLTNGIVIVENGRVLTHYSGGPGDYALYFHLSAADLNADGLDDLILLRNVEDNDDVIAYIFQTTTSDPKFLGETLVYSSTAGALADGAEKVKATAYLATASVSSEPAFLRTAYSRTGSDSWIESQQVQLFRLENHFEKEYEPALKRIGSTTY